jgi:hypothetical protein
MNPRSNPVFPFPHGELQFTGITVRDLARIAVLHGLLVSGRDLDPQGAADYAMKTVDALFPGPSDMEKAVNVDQIVAAMGRVTEVPASSKRQWWRLW